MKVFIQFQDQFGHWKHLTMNHHQPTAFKMAKARAKNTGKRHRLLDENKNLLDLCEP
jgi:hypothetical protein|tara:strand:- start:761 stop:931 length:171 start_codon:yes stop_codon:yes gene_type:complete